LGNLAKKDQRSDCILVGTGAAVVIGVAAFDGKNSKKDQQDFKMRIAT
jgi:hypothetical protein